MTNFPALLSGLAVGGVEFIVVGGLAATAHGSARATFDVDVVYRRSAENLRRIVNTLHPHNVRLRGAPEGLPFKLDERTLEKGLNFTFRTDLGDIDLLGEIAGGGRYEDLLPCTLIAALFGVTCRCLTLDKLIEVKRAAGRPKDLEAVAELEAILEEEKREP